MCGVYVWPPNHVKSRETIPNIFHQSIGALGQWDGGHTYISIYVLCYCTSRNQHDHQAVAIQIDSIDVNLFDINRAVASLHVGHLPET